ncbi:MAG: chemotaxis protein [Gammaproteobacteria bacterium]|nr:MAG: chemotaxis protein [Gammaproteobacteria bacterium]
MYNFVIACGIIMLVLFGWVAVQNLARRFANNHPEFGPYVEKRGCGGNCSCAEGSQCIKE